jgi:SCP-2 sterol transfer family
VQYLSAEWMDAAARALAGDTGLKEATADVVLTLEQVVTGVPGARGGPGESEVRWHVRVDRGSVALVPGPAEAFDVRFTTDYATAAATASGATGAQQAFAEGRLRVGGDVAALGRNQRAFAAVTDALAAVRGDTTNDHAPAEGG